MKQFVTGGAGFIGSNYVRYVLENTDDEVTVYDALTYAGNLSTLKDVDDDPRYQFVKGDICDPGALDDARRLEVPRVVHIGTDEVYGSVEVGSSKETDPLEPRSPYSASKAGSDLIALSYHHTYGLPVTVSRCHNTLGP